MTERISYDAVKREIRDSYREGLWRALVLLQAEVDYLFPPEECGELIDPRYDWDEL